MLRGDLKSVTASANPVAVGSAYYPRSVSKLTINVALIESLIGRVDWDLTDWTPEEREENFDP